MPNDCSNHVTIYAEPDVINTLNKKGLYLPELIQHTKLSDDLRVYDYSLVKVGRTAIRFTITSAWGPANDLFEALVNEYSISFLKNDWYVEDGAAGVWVAESKGGEKPTISFLEWDEGCLEEIHHRFEEAKPAQQNQGAPTTPAPFTQ